MENFKVQTRNEIEKATDEAQRKLARDFILIFFSKEADREKYDPETLDREESDEIPDDHLYREEDEIPDDHLYREEDDEIKIALRSRRMRLAVE